MFSISFLEFNQIYGGRKQQRIFSIGEKKIFKKFIFGWKYFILFVGNYSQKKKFQKQ